MLILKKLLISVAAVFAPVAGVLGTVLFLTTLDFVLGIAAAKKTGIPITSNRMRDSVGKIVAYESAIVIGFLAQHYLTSDLVPFINIIGTYIALTEGTSCLENINKLTGKQLLSEAIKKINDIKD